MGGGLFCSADPKCQQYEIIRAEVGKTFKIEKYKHK